MRYAYYPTCLLVLAPHRIKHFLDLMQCRCNCPITPSPSVTVLPHSHTLEPPVCDTTVQFVNHDTFQTSSQDVVGTGTNAITLFFGNHNKPPMNSYLLGTFIRVIYMRNLLNYTTLEGYTPSRVGMVLSTVIDRIQDRTVCSSCG